MHSMVAFTAVINALEIKNDEMIPVINQVPFLEILQRLIGRIFLPESSSSFRDPEYWNGAKTRRFYLEIGGHEGVRESNSRLFDACLGWDGLLVEPTIKNYQRMVKLRPNAHHLGMAPSCNSSGVAMFHKNLYTNAVANKEGATIAVHCGPLSGPLKQLGIRRIDFWSLDVEGSELAVLETVDFDAVRIDVIMAESENNLPGKEHLAEEVRAFLKQKGYLLLKSVMVFKSDVFLHKSVCPRYHFLECYLTF